MLFGYFAFVSGENCVVYSKTDGGDDTPALLDAFRVCGENGSISLPDPTYHIKQVMNTTELRNCRIDLKGTLLVCQRDPSCVIASFNPMA
jgi:galacturan 1,4-alpha-galacturonidase